MAEFVSFGYHVSKELSTPSSPNFNPIEYWALSAIKAWTNRRAHTNNTPVIATIKKNFAILERDMVFRACGQFRGRVEAVIEIGGDFIS